MRFTAFRLLSFAVLLLAVVVTSGGLFSTGGPGAFSVTNRYGDSVKLWGDGLYAYDSFFRAPILRGTDLTVLVLACPLLLLALVRDAKEPSLRNRLQLFSILSTVLYYAANLAFGVAYNSLHLVYIAFFSCSLFAVICGTASLSARRVERAVTAPFPLRGLTIFLAVTGLVLFTAWLPDIIGALAAGRPVSLIETYTTEVTYVLDIGVIAPLCFACLFLLRRRKGPGYVLLDVLLTLCLVIGVMLPVQTLFQAKAGIVLPLPVLLTKVGSFCALAFFAAVFKVRLWRNLGETKAAVRQPPEFEPV